MKKICVFQGTVTLGVDSFIAICQKLQEKFKYELETQKCGLEIIKTMYPVKTNMNLKLENEHSQNGKAWQWIQLKQG